MSEEKSQSKTPQGLDFNDVDILKRYVTDTGKILPRRITGLTALQQRRITKAIKRARNLLLMK
ncbi:MULTISPECIES: 30S ribosomal protein S18 [Ruficoccus]|uniref:Small ribosomal subunit protein bS18 n=1 Tax=Ruficoccus amylovorans TaxID=1804625 RepID=A0A842HHS8_9BACT|nr:MULTISPECIES: 30S ribosomal protein S18 [Ruficoccus]MBC2596083.1 30S ribosomal protein S18 [Ruficoccus amylovorans]QYY36830.1 30S ribosomal protein S18 [Ruficoccus sp. ZRK36]